MKGIHTGTVFLEGVMRPSADDIHIEYNPIRACDDFLQPLPLSDAFFESLKLGKWEDQFGYQRQYHGSSSTYTIRVDEDGYYIGMIRHDGPIHITPTRFKAIHQLQNIHFAQYGEELSISYQDVKTAWRITKIRLQENNM